MPTRPLLSISASSFVHLVLTPRARTMSSLFPVALRALPISVPKNQYITATIRMAAPIPMTWDAWAWLKPVADETMVTMDLDLRRGMLLLPPIIQRLMDHRDIWVRIPARMDGISKTVCRMPVTKPASIPARVAMARAATGFIPLFTIRVAQTQPPRAKLPSTVKSAISRSLKVMYTPSTMIPQSTPCPTASSRFGPMPCIRFAIFIFYIYLRSCLCSFV